MRLLVLIFLITFLFSKEVVAVLNLNPTGLTKDEAKVLTQRLTSELIEINNYTIVERSSIDKILQEQKSQNSGCTNSQCAVEIGQLLNSDLIVIGTVSKLGSAYNIDARMINVEDGSALKSATFTKKGPMEILLDQGVFEIAMELSGNKKTTNILNKSKYNNSEGLYFNLPSKMHKDFENQ